MRVKVSRREFVRTAGSGGVALAVTVVSLICLIGAAISMMLLHRRSTQYVPGEKDQDITEALSRKLPPGCPRIRFEDITARAGIHFQHFHGARSSQLPEDMGSGAAWGDFNQDGYPDLFLVNQAGPLTQSPQQVQSSPARCALYRNNGDGTFTDVTDAAGLGGLKGSFMGAAWGDFDNDGYPDLFITAYGENRLFHNNGNGTFTDVTQRAGVGGIPGFWTGASWGDYDRDGRLDLYVCGYVRYHTPRGNERSMVSMQNNSSQPFTINPVSYPPASNLLYHNNGDGTFTEVAGKLGVADPTGRSLSATWCDFDGDGWPDLYVNNDVSMHACYRNLGNGHFEDVSTRSLGCDYRGGMGIAIGDWNNDGDQDMFLTHWLAEENALYDNLHDSIMQLKGKAPCPIQFSDISDQVGLGQSTIDYVGWGTAFLDLDNDGWLDLVMSNGSTLQQDKDPTRLVPMKNQLFWNAGRTRGFYEIEDAVGGALPIRNNGRGLAIADFDRDGKVDLVITRNGGPPLLLHNETIMPNHWIDIQLRGVRCNRDAMGARLTVIAGKSTQIREIGSGSSYLSQNDLTQTVGLGTADHLVTLKVWWPSGQEQTFHNIPADQFIRITEGGAPETVRLKRAKPS